MTRLLDEKSNGLITALTGKGQEFAGEVSRVTDHAVKSIEAKSFVFTQTMMDNSEEIARLINEASQNATSAMTRTLGQMQEGAEGVTEGAKTSIARTLADLHSATRAAVEESKQTAAATVADMLETHGMLRSDSTALFERLREANILLQEVLSGAHENMNSIEHTMASRVSEFVSAMNELSNKSGATTAKVEQHLGTFNTVTAKVLRDLGELSTQFATQGRSLAEAVQLLDMSNRRSEETVGSRQATIETLVTTLDARSDDFEQRLQRFSGLLDESLDAATTRTREIASLIAETSNDSVRTIEQQYDLVRSQAEEERKRTSETLQRDLRRGVHRGAGHVQPVRRALHHHHAGHEADGRGNAAGARDHAHRIAPWRPRTAAGDRREHVANAPRHRRSDRSLGRAQSHRRPPRPRARCRRTGAARGGSRLCHGRRPRPGAADPAGHQPAAAATAAAAAAGGLARHHRRTGAPAGPG